MSSVTAAPLANPAVMRRAVQMQYGAQTYYGDQGYSGQHGSQQVVWYLSGTTGVIGFSNGMGIQGHDYRWLPYVLRNGDERVLSRWNMATQKLTVSRMQCKVEVSADGTAALTSCGRGPTVWRDAYGGPWQALWKGDWRILQEGDQIGLDWHRPESAVFTCQVQVGSDGHDGYGQQQQGGYPPQQQGGYEYPAPQGGYDQQQYGGYDQQGYPSQQGGYMHVS